MFLVSSDYFEIKKTVNKGRGVFAKQDILKGTVIGDYLGKVINPALESLPQDKGLYLMYYHDYALIYPVDLNAPGIHLINHSCSPNCWMYIYKGHTLFFALRNILKGEELTISYLLAPEDSCTGCSHQCKCQTKFCTKTMHLPKDKFEQWDKFRKGLNKETKRQRIKYGAVLPSLKTYPNIIANHPIYDLINSMMVK